MGIAKRILTSLIYLGAGAAAMANPDLRIGEFWHGIAPRQTVIMNGVIAKGQLKAWSTYRNGLFHKEELVDDSFRVPAGMNLMIVQADLTFQDTRKGINIEFILKQNITNFPLARATFTNPDGCPYFTATKTFMTGLVIPQNGRLNILDKDLSSTYEVTLYGFYFR